jgi:uncharacterized coiled-coil protein SlyX
MVALNFLSWKVIGVLAGLLVLTATLGIGSCSYQSGKIDKLNRELGEAKATIQVHLDTIDNKQRAFDEVVALNAVCAGARASAEEAGTKAAAELELLKGKLREANKSRVDEIKSEKPTTAVCSVPVPPRSTRLLIEAARAANRGSDGN